MKFKHFILVSVLALLQSNCAVEEEPIISSYSTNYKEINGDVDTEDSNDVIEIVDNSSDIRDIVASTKLPRKGIYNTTECALNNNQVDSVYLNSVKSITAGDRHTCALLNSGDVACWGNDNPRAFCEKDLNDVVKIDSNGGYQLCALKNNGLVYCSYPDGSRFSIESLSKVYNLYDVIDIGSGDYGDHCAITKDGITKCWSNRFHNIEDLNTVNFTELVPIEINSLKNPKSLKTNSGRTCILTQNNTISCIYYNEGYYENSLIYYDIPNMNNISQFDFKLGSELCAVQEGNVYCSSAYPNSKPYKIDNLNDVNSITVSYKLNCALLNNGTVRCWNPQDKNNLIQDIDISNVIQITAGGYNDGLYSHACALIDNGTVKCWGDNYNGQLGIGTSDNNTNVPTLVETN